ncbi:hypothetical protein ALI22I_34595 [Saccharothrix sp. ALI-22-I]|nr:hypothetical protein ALI22I_34595 [Saccharothrix sp. ALI-22-I]
MVAAVLGAVALGTAGCGQAAQQSGAQQTGAQQTGAEVTASPHVLTGPASATSEVQVSPKLSPHGKDVLAQAERAGATSVVLTIATEPGATERTVADLQRLGATVEASDATIGYVRVSVPIALAERAASAEGVRQADVDEPLSYGDPTP